MSKVLSKEYRHLRYHDDPHHKSNWCRKCGLYYCWHPECTGEGSEEYRNDARANHEFKPINQYHYNWFRYMHQMLDFFTRKEMSPDEYDEIFEMWEDKEEK